ncbi:MAG: helix-turn-helix domain-containing protein [Mycobacteriales bacterium]
MTSGGGNPLVRRRRLAVELRRLRAASGQTLEEVADYLECSPAKVSRIENGQVTVRIQDAKELLDLYDVAGDQREALLEMVRQARRKGWWHPYADLVKPETGLEKLLSLEDEATALYVHETNLVPGLLQTTGYTTFLMNSRDDYPPAVLDRYVDLRMRRQQVLERPDAPALHAVLDEAVLRRRVGGPKVMKDQYEALIAVSERPNITLRVLPFDAGPHQAMGFAFHLFEFSGTDPQVVYVEHLEGAAFVEQLEEVARYRAAFTQASGYALDPERTREFIADFAEMAEKQDDTLLR